MPTAERAAAVAAALLAALTGLVMAADPLPGEALVLTAAHVDDGAARAVADRVSRASGSQVGALVAGGCCAVLLLRRRGGDAVLLAAVMVTVLVLVPLLKSVVARPRPDTWLLPADVSEHAYPSGHATVVAALTVTLLSVRGPGPTAGGWAARSAVVVGLLVTSWAQLALGRHHPTDLLAGWLLAGAVVAAGVALRRRH